VPVLLARSLDNFVESHLRRMRLAASEVTRQRRDFAMLLNYVKY
jgi:hypothetical protein